MQRQDDSILTVPFDGHQASTSMIDESPSPSMSQLHQARGPRFHNLTKNSDLDVIRAPNKQPSSMSKYHEFENGNIRGFNAQQLVDEIRRQQAKGTTIEIKGMGYESCKVRRDEVKEQIKQQERWMASKGGKHNKFKVENKISELFAKSQNLYKKKE